MSGVPHMTSPIDAALTTAVAEALTPVNYTTIAQAICRSQNGGGGRMCLCERQVWKKCHAAQTYGDMALAVLELLKRSKL